MIPLPIFTSEYSVLSASEYVSIPLLYWSHLPTAIVGIIFAWFIYQQTKKSSALYLLLTAIIFGLYSYFDLLTWVGQSPVVMFGWSVIDIFSIALSITTYWFFYSFVRGSDLSPKHMLLTAIPVLPPLVYTALSMNISEYYAPDMIAIENPFFINFAQVIVPGFFVLLILVVGFKELLKQNDSNARRRIALGVLGANMFLLSFLFFQLYAALLLYFEFGNPNEAYTFTTYSLFSMPIFITFLGYLVTKYQAFDIRLTKSVGMILVLMLLLFISIFI